MTGNNFIKFICHERFIDVIVLAAAVAIVNSRNQTIISPIDFS
jgi:hypothetical protein